MQNAITYPDEYTNAQKCQLWLKCGLICEQEYDLLRQIMEQHNPKTVVQNRLVIMELFREVGELSDCE